uniref:Uncharacterized protein n=1 Tax=Oryza sativa subsp. japonica TaxID=39947 RepID=Q2QN22_ORYSJ|nr:hypothetical protein LOC_Os12g39250 [Oryza sativa Japonica Group]
MRRWGCGGHGGGCGSQRQISSLRRCRREEEVVFVEEDEQKQEEQKQKHRMHSTHASTKRAQTATPEIVFFWDKDFPPEIDSLCGTEGVKVSG